MKSKLKKMLENENKIMNPLKKENKLIPLLILIVLATIILLGKSYAWFTKTYEVKDIQIVVNKLTYTLTSNRLNDSNQILVDAGETIAFDILVTNKNLFDTKYQVVYSSSDDLTDVQVGYNTLTVDAVNGEIEKNGVRTVSVVVINHSTKSKTIEFNIRGGLKNNEVSDIILASNDIKLLTPLQIVVENVMFTSTNLENNCTTYDDGVDTFLVGQCSQNYVWYSGKLWRVVLKNNETSAVKMVTDNAITSIPYSVSGNTAFKDSYMDQWLSQEFLPTLHDYEDYLVVNSVWDATADSSTTPARPAGTTTVTRTVGLLNAYEYYTTYASSSSLADSSTVYLHNKASDSFGIDWWVMTPSSSSRVWSVIYDGSLSLFAQSNGYGARPAVNMKTGIQIASGNGTNSYPYILEEDVQEAAGGTTLLSTRYSGEYVMFNNELYRIVGVEDGLTKITAVNKPTSLLNNKFHTETGAISFVDASIKGDLETYYQGLKTTNETAFNMIQPETTWYLGTVDKGENYKASICATVDANISMSACSRTTKTTTASIALPRAGEMFTSQITKGPKQYFWTLTTYSSSGVLRVTRHSFLTVYDPTSDGGARPSMYLKSNVVIASSNTGNGTYEYPYSIELAS